MGGTTLSDIVTIDKPPLSEPTDTGKGKSSLGAAQSKISLNQDFRL